MTSNDVKRLLQSVADQGATTVEVDEHLLVPRIRRRRFRRTATISAAGLATAAVIAVSASAVLPDRRIDTPVADPSTPSQSASPSQPIATVWPAQPFACGALFPAPSSIGHSFEVFTQKTMTRTADGWSGTMNVKFTNPLPSRLMNASPDGDFVVVLKNKVVGHAVVTVSGRAVELAPKQSHIFQAQIQIGGCGSAADVPAGSYLIYRNTPADSKPVPPSTKEVLPSAELQLN